MLAKKQEHSNKPWLIKQPANIPSMASSAAKEFAKIQLNYKKLIETAEQFYDTWPKQSKQLHQQTLKLAGYQEQLGLIEEKLNTTGQLPKIRGQQCSHAYISKLEKLEREAKAQLIAMQREVEQQRQKRWYLVDQISDKLLDLIASSQSANQLLGTIMLSAPLPEEKVRCIRNERFKPLYSSSLMMIFFQYLQGKYQFQHPYIIKTAGENTEHLTRIKLYKPMLIAALLQTIGSFSTEADLVYAGDRYRVLENHEREQLNKVVKQQSLAFVTYGLGIIQPRLLSKFESELHKQQETEKLKFILEIIQKRDQADFELKDLFQLPIIYASFLFSTKPEFDYPSILSAYTVLQAAMDKGLIKTDYAPLFLKMVGRFPVGCGIYFYSPTTDSIEKAIVSSLEPDNADEPVCKPITRNQMHTFCHHEIIVSRPNNIFFSQARKKCQRHQTYLKHRCERTFIWNANALWEVQVTSNKFWLKDGTLKYI